MELISSQIDKIEDLLSRMDEVIDLARSVPFSGKISVEKDALYSVIDDIRGTIYDMRKGLPSEMNQARRVMSDRDNIVSEARHKAEMMIKAAESEANRILNEHDLTQQAKLHALKLEETAKEQVADFKLNAAQYVIGIFDDLDDLLEKTLEEHMSKAREVENFYSSVLAEIHDSRNTIRVDR